MTVILSLTQDSTTTWYQWPERAQHHTHIRREPYTWNQYTKCGAPPAETISAHHYRLGQVPDSPHAGHINRLPASLCPLCVTAMGTT